jgi:ornithine carbamoyltransferase
MSELSDHQRLLSLQGWDRADLRDVLASAAELRDRRQVGLSDDPLRLKVLGLLFESPSLRARLAFEVGVGELGGTTVHLGAHEIGLGRRESLSDVAAVYGRFTHGVVLRTPNPERLSQFAAACAVPVFNAGTSLGNPGQVLADLFTMQRHFGSLDGQTIVFLGPAGPVLHSWLEIAPVLGLTLHLAAPPGMEPRTELLRAAVEAGATIRLTRKPQEAVRDAGVIYLEPWPVPSQAQAAEEYQRLLKPYRLEGHLLSFAAHDAVVMHAMPVGPGREIDPRIVHSPQSLVLEQAENHLHVIKALLSMFL